jgi:hypothetical protein
VEGRRVLSLFFLSVVMLPHRSGQISKNAAFYYTHAKYRRGKLKPRESEVKTEWTPVVKGLPRPQLN